jgi:hypothetical protein
MLAGIIDGRSICCVHAARCRYRRVAQVISGCKTSRILVGAFSSREPASTSLENGSSADVWIA